MEKLTYKDLEINLYEGNLGVKASGGADSSLLLYLLAKYTDSPITAYVLSSKQYNYVEETIVRTVVDKIHEILSKECIKVSPILVEQKTLEVLLYETNKQSEADKIDMLYGGITKSPNTLINNLPLSDDEIKDRDPSYKSETLFENKYAPFANVDKRKISEIYNEENIVDTIFPLTLSCIRIISGQTKKHCEECWFCKERLWAFGRII